MMAEFDLYSLRNTFEEQGVMICFNGPFSHSVIEELGEAVRRYLKSADAPKSRVTDVFSVFVEQAQNLKNYTAREDSLGPNGTLVIAREHDRYLVSSGNLVEREDAERLRSRLDDIAELDRDGLKQLYKKRLREPVEEGAGAGIGFVTMARKSPEPLKYSLRDMPDGTGFFTVSVVV